MEEGGQISHLILQIDTNAALLRNTTDVPPRVETLNYLQLKQCHVYSTVFLDLLHLPEITMVIYANRCINP